MCSPTVDDPDARSPRLRPPTITNRPHSLTRPSPARTNIPEYVTVVNSWKSGLPYDFDQVRVFIWNLKKHRYETSFRERNIEGYLPVRSSSPRTPTAKTPTPRSSCPPSATPSSQPTLRTRPRPEDRRDQARADRHQDLPSRRQHLPPHPPTQHPRPREAHPTPEPKKEKKAKSTIETLGTEVIKPRVAGPLSEAVDQ